MQPTNQASMRPRVFPAEDDEQQDSPFAFAKLQ